jgi:hypothetical protein
MSIDIIDLTTPAGLHIRTPPSAVFVYVDETGDASLADPVHPIFGLGGCVIRAQWYRTMVSERWNMMKNRHFKSSDLPLHATDLRTPTIDQLNALNGFFSDSQFGRFATIFSDKTIVEGKVDLTELAVVSTLSRVKDLVSGMTFSRMIFLIEESPKADRFLSIMQGYNLTQNGHPIYMDKYIMKKEGHEPGLEVADFIVHCAGTAVRARLKGKRNRTNERKDFEVVFKTKDPRLSSYLEVIKIQDTTPKGDQKRFDFSRTPDESGTA